MLYDATGQPLGTDFATRPTTKHAKFDFYKVGWEYLFALLGMVVLMKNGGILPDKENYLPRLKQHRDVATMAGNMDGALMWNNLIRSLEIEGFDAFERLASSYAIHIPADL